MTRHLALLLATIGMALATIALLSSEHQPPNNGLPLVKSDFPVCVTVAPGPIKPPRRDVFHPNVNGELS